MLVVVAAALSGVAPQLLAQSPNLKSAASFAVLGGSRVTSSGNTIVSGNVGVSPGRTVTGLLSPAVGDVHRDDALGRQAQKDNASAYRILAATRPCKTLTSLSGVITSGVYCVSAAEVTGTLTLDAKTNPSAVWAFLVTGSLATSPHSVVAVINGGRDSNVFWQTDGAVSLGANSTFLGTVLALADITVGDAATVSGRLLTQNGSVTLNAKDVTICCEPITFTTAALPNGNAGIAYFGTIMAAGGTGPYTYSLIDGTLPSGLTLNLDGTLSGMPTICGGTFTVTVAATDAFGCSGAQQYTVVIDCTTSSGIVLLPASLPNARQGFFYQEMITATGGAPPYAFVLSCGTLPPGITLMPSGVLAGTPAASGTFSFGVTARDVISHAGSRCFTLKVSPGCSILIFTPTNLPDGALGARYDQVLRASGGSEPYVFTTDEKTLPPGLSLLSGGNIIGIPTQTGCFTFKVTVRDDTGCFSTATYTICIPCTTPLAIVPPFPPSGVVGNSYNATIFVSGGSGSYVFSAPPPLPPGVSLSTDGVLTGIPILKGCYTFDVFVLDTTTRCLTRRTITICIDCPEITLAPAALPNGVIGAPYAQTIVPNGGTPPYSFALGSEPLPPGIGGPSQKGLLSGTPTLIGLFQFSIVVTDAYGCTVMRDYSITIVPVSPPPPVAGDAPVLSFWATVVLMILIALIGVVFARAGRL
jgi:hypothetical protein